MRVHLVRHGQSAWNAEGRLQGQTPHVPLTELGRRQAFAAARQLVERSAERAITALHTSDLTRAAETATIIGVALNLTPRPTEALREQALGRLEGRLTRDLVAEPTPEGAHVSEVAWGGGESIEHVWQRIDRWLPTVLTGARDVVLVTHGDTMRVALTWLRGLGHRDVVWRPIDNGEIVTVEYQAR